MPLFRAWFFYCEYFSRHLEPRRRRGTSQATIVSRLVTRAEQPLPHMIAKKESHPAITRGADPGSANSTETSLPNSRKVYVPGQRHPELRVPFREISLAPTKTMSGEMETNEPVRVYDTSGPWGDADQSVDVTEGLPALRSRWIRERGDVEEVDGREAKPIDDGYLSVTHAESARRNGMTNDEFRRSNGSNGHLSTFNSPLSTRRKPLRAKPGNCATQLYYARQGIITPEMEFIAIRENASAVRAVSDLLKGEGRRSESAATEFTRNALSHQHRGESFGANIPREIPRKIKLILKSQKSRFRRDT